MDIYLSLSKSSPVDVLLQAVSIAQWGRGAIMRYTSASISILLLIGCFVLTGCYPSKAIPNNNPPDVSWSLYDLTTHTQKLNAATGSPTVVLAPGDVYFVTFQATSSAGIHTITLSGNGKVNCRDYKFPFDTKHTFSYSIAPTTITLTPPAGQVYTQGANPYGFLWEDKNSPAFPAFTKCGANVPLVGTTIFTGTTTTTSNVSSSPVQLTVTSSVPITN